MLKDDAEKIAAAIEERMNAGDAGASTVKARMKAEELRPQSVPAGAGRPSFYNYYIHIDDGSRLAVLHMGQAAGLLDEIEPGWDADRLYQAIEAREIPITDSPPAE